MRDGEPVIVIDETPVVAEEPIYAGLHVDERLGSAYGRVVSALRQLYGARYRNQAPADDAALFRELDEEVILPHSPLIAKLIRAVHDKEGLTAEEEEQILSIIDEFLVQMPRE